MSGNKCSIVCPGIRVYDSYSTSVSGNEEIIVF